MGPAILTVAPTGPVATRADHPGLPTQPQEIADHVAGAQAAGASVAHLHFRDAEHQPTADLDVAGRTIDAVRERCPSMLVQVSTGVGMGVGFAERAALVERRPQLATLNPASMSFGEGEFRNPPPDVRRLAARMLELGVKPELEIYDTGHLELCLVLRDAGLLAEPLQFSIVLGVVGGMAATPDNLLTMVRRLPSDALWQVVAVGRHNLPLTAIALALGGNARAGLEDTLHLRKGELAPDNAVLVTRAARLAHDLDRTVAGPEQAAALLGIAWPPP